MACHQELRTSGRASGTMFMELGDEARTLGANAIVGIDLDYENIFEKKEQGEKLERIQDELETLKKMRSSNIDGKSSD
jgi:hypothetical protein